MAKVQALARDREDDEYEVQSVDSNLDMSLGERLSKVFKEFSLKKSVLKLSSSMENLPLGNYIITTDSKQYQAWWLFMVVIATYSTMFTPLEFGFFRGLPRFLWVVDLSVQFIFVADIAVRFCTAYRDPETFRLIVDHKSIGLRYIKSDFFFDLLGCLPWDTIYKGLGRKEEVRYLVWVRLYRVRKVDSFFERLEKDIRINYFGARIVKLLAVEFYCTHTAACIYYYLATTVKARKESYTWIGSLTLGSFSYTNFRAIDLGKRYVTSLYWAVLTMATVGYGDIHAVNPREMIFVMIYVSFDMILGAYLVGNMTALIVKGSNTERFRDKMTSLIKFMNRNGLPRDVRQQMKNHVRLQFESGTMSDEHVLAEIPIAIRSRVSKVTEEHFLPGEVVTHQGGSSDQFYIVCHGCLEEILIHEDGREETIDVLEAQSVFGEVGVLCNIPQPFTVRVVELSRVLRLDKTSFSDLVQIYFNDGRRLINNLLEWKDADARAGQIAAEVTFLVAKQAAEIALMVNNASYQGDLEQLKHLVKAGAVVARADYDGRTALHLAASKGFESVVLYLIREGAEVNSIDKFGNTPLLEAVKGGHDSCLYALLEKGAELHLHDSGSFLCQAVKNGNDELLRRLLIAGVDLSSSDYDKRTALHLSAAEGLYAITKTLIDAGADIFAQDRWGRTPLDEAMLHNHSALIPLLKDAAQKRKCASLSPAPTVLKPTLRARRAPKGTSDSERRVDEEDTIDGHGRSPGQICIASPQSAASSETTPRGGLYSGMERQTSSERRLDTKLWSFAPPRHSGGLECEQLAHQYRMLPVRPVGRLSQSEQPSMLMRTRRRLTIFPYHPWTPTRTRSAGKVEWVPVTVGEVLELASQHFGKEGTKVLNQDGGEISSTDFIMDSEKVYVVNESDLQTLKDDR